MKTGFLGILKRKKLLVLGCTAGLCLALGVAYYLGCSHGEQLGENTKLPAAEGLNCDTFSEIDNAKCVLQALSSRCVAQVATTCRSSAAGEIQGDKEARKPLTGAINQLEAGLQEFRGAEPELVVAEGLLRTLSKAGEASRWMAVYLDLLYRHPTSELVARLAKEATVLSKSTGRRQDLSLGFEHLCRIPLEFDGKQRVQAALVQLERENQVGLIELEAPETTPGGAHVGG
jgi:hypothetical protein